MNRMELLKELLSVALMERYLVNRMELPKGTKVRQLV